MLRSYLSSALRNLLAQGMYTAINVAGLAVGLASVVVIALFVRHELGHDGFFPKSERIFRISRDYFATAGARARVPASNNAPVAPMLLEDFPEIEAVGRIFGGRRLLRRGEIAFYEDAMRWADPSILEIFDFDWVAGDPRTALAQPSSIVLTQSAATRYFGTEDPLGQTLTTDRDLPLEVTGVIRDLPADTHLSISGLMSMSEIPALFGGPAILEQRNSMTDFYTYFLLREGARVATIEAGIPEFMNRRIGENASAVSGMTIMNVRDIHARSTRDEEWKPPGSLATIYGFAAIAVLILLVACINFTNLATALATRRAREVGVRKSLGATRTQVIVQFLGESVLAAAVAMLLAAMLVELALPVFGALVGVDLTLDYFGSDAVALWLLVLVVIVGIAAGSYPAFYLSAFEPAKVLKGDIVSGGSGSVFRNALVVAQFGIAIALLIGTTVVYRQTTFARTLDLGFEKEQVVVLTASAVTGLGPQWPAMKQELLRHPGIASVTASHYTPFSFDDNTLLVRRLGGSAGSRIQYMAVDYDFFETYRIDILSGRAFSRELGTDVPLVQPTPEAPGNVPNGLVINEAAARLLGLPATAGDQPIEVGFDEEFRRRVVGDVIGLARDTYFESVQVALRPLVFVLAPDGRSPVNPLDAASIRLTGAGLDGALAHIDATWRQFKPELPVERHFLDQDFDALYRSEQRQSRLFGVFAALAVAIACLGLFGLASLATVRRTKEIGIRKVMGGTVWDVVTLLTSGFGKLVLLANVVAWPIAYVAMQRWLSGFAYRAEMSPWIYVGSAALALVIACVTVGLVAARAAAAKPIAALRHE